jgi:hypothetical protein
MEERKQLPSLPLSPWKIAGKKHLNYRRMEPADHQKIANPEQQHNNISSN